MNHRLEKAADLVDDLLALIERVLDDEYGPDNENLRPHLVTVWLPEDHNGVHQILQDGAVRLPIRPEHWDAIRDAWATLHAAAVLADTTDQSVATPHGGDGPVHLTYDYHARADSAEREPIQAARGAMLPNPTPEELLAKRLDAHGQHIGLDRCATCGELAGHDVHGVPGKIPATHDFDAGGAG